MSGNTRKLGPVAVALVVIAGLVWAFLPRPLEVDVARVERGPFRVTVDEEGKTRVRERYLVSAPLEGRLRRIPLEAGAAVRAGETPLATIDPLDPALLDARSRAEAEARVRAAEAAEAQAGPNLDRARADHALAAQELERAKRLFENEVVSRQELDEAERKERTTAADLEAARFATEIAAFELEVARAALVRTRPGSLEDGTLGILSPVDGRVLRVFEESETVVRPGEKLMELGDPTDLEVEIDVLSSDAVRIPAGAEVVLEHWGGELPLGGRVRLVEPGGFTKVSALGVEEQRVNVIVDLTDPPEVRRSLGDGYRVDARIVVWEDPDVLRVPSGALFRREEQWAAFAIEGRRARLRTLRIGQQNGLEAQVLDGLREGQRVVLHPSDRIDDGVLVTPR